MPKEAQTNIITPETRTNRRSWSNRVRDVWSVPEVGVLFPTALALFA
jgi:hypothetical protein